MQPILVMSMASSSKSEAWTERDSKAIHRCALITVSQEQGLVLDTKGSL